MARPYGLVGVLLVVADLCAIVSSFYLAFTIRTILNPLFDEQFDFSLASTVFFPLYLTALLWLLTFRQLGLYAYERRFDLSRMFLQISKGCTLVFIFLVLASFFTSRESYSRSLLIFLLPSSVFTVTCWRLAAVGALRWLTRQGYGSERVAVVGWEEAARRLAAKIERQPALVFCGYIGLDSSSSGAVPADTLYLGSLDEIEKLIERHQLTRLVCQDHVRSRERLVRLAEVCQAAGASLDVVPDFFEFLPRRIQLTELGGIPLVNIRSLEMSRWDRLVKRVVDVAVAVTLLAILAPALAVIALVLLIESPGGAIYRQTRIGKDGRPFTVLKFRSMRADADARRATLLELNEREGALFKIRLDPRLTRSGRVIRRYSLDELPQLVNVVRGEMSLVGPRPLPVKDLEKLDMERYGYWFGQRLRVLPGITGLWQVSGRSELSFEEMVELDIYYIESWSLTLDCEILLRTVTEVASGRGAY